jgi:hypothetical protein
MSGSFTIYHRNLRRPYATILFVLNALISWRLFKLEYSRFMGSIEGAYIGISRHILNSGGDLGWWGAWYGGIPFQNSYPPLLHYLVAAAAWLGHISVARSHHIVTALFFSLGPVAAYWTAKRITGRPNESFLAALLYSVLAPSGLLIPAIALDMGGAWNARRLQALVVYGDGPHIASLALLPLAVLLLHIALEKKKPAWDFLAALGMAAVVLTNWLGAFALAGMIACLLVRRQDWIRAGCIGAFAYLLVCPLLPPSLIATIQLNAQTVGGDFRATSTRVLLFLPCAAIVLILLRRVSVFVKFGLLMATLTLLRSYFDFDIVPQADRYHLEMDLGIIFGAVVVFAKIIPDRARVVASCALVLLCGAQALHLRYYARGIINNIDVSEHVEYQSAEWFTRNIPGERVMAPGSIQFWLNAFTDCPQIGGGFENGNISWENRVARYYIGVGKEIPNVVLFLKAFGVHAVETTGPLSDEVFKDFADARKFDGSLEQVWRSGDDTIYRVPGDSSAHVIPRSALVIKPPENGLDVFEVQRYVNALNRPARLEWRGSSHALIEAHVEAGQVISVQENFHKGWHSNNGRIFQDGLGFIAVEPTCIGACRIDLDFDGGREMTVARWTSRTALVGGLIWIWISRRRRSSASSETQAQLSAT